GEPLSKETKHLRGDLPLAAPAIDRDGPKAPKRERRRRGEEGERRAGAPVFPPHHDQHADEEGGVTDQRHRETREKARERGDIAVDPFDELTRGPRLVEAEVKPQTVEREVRTQRVGGGPSERLPDVLGRGRQELRRERNNDERQRRKDEWLETCARERGVDEEAQQLRIHEL